LRKLAGELKRAIKHARDQLRKAGIRPPTDNEALLAASIDRQSDPAADPCLCACGCGQPARRGRRGPASKWHSDACRKRRRHAGHGWNPHAHERPHPARPLAGSGCSFSIEGGAKPSDGQMHDKADLTRRSGWFACSSA
jgi:hypothetical protein